MHQPTEIRRRVIRLLSALAVVGAVAVTAAAFVGTSGDAQAAPPGNTGAPTVNGVLTEGATLTANPGTWTGDGPFTYAY